MRWEEVSTTEAARYSADSIDVAFRLAGRWLRVDHACSMRDAVVNVLPWLEDEPAAGIQSIHGAASGNGWQGPDGATEAVLSLSRRTRLVLRVPVGREEATSVRERSVDDSNSLRLLENRRTRHDDSLWSANAPGLVQPNCVCCRSSINPLRRTRRPAP